MIRNDVEIKIVDRQAVVEADSIDYQPFGVKILKLRIRRNQETKPALGPIWIQPRNYIRPAGDNWQAYGTADDDPDLWVAWGAGDEKGFCAKTADPFGFSKNPAPLDDDGEYFVYLHLIHRPADPLKHTPVDKTLTVIAASEDQHGHLLCDDQGQVLALGQLQVKLTVPAGAANPLQAVWEWDVPAGRSTITLRGAAGGARHFPRYVSRWWPRRQIAYEELDPAAAAFVDKLQVVYQRQGGGQDRSAIDVLHDGQVLAHFGGDLGLPLHDYRLSTVELFRFPDNYHLVLRLWFYWVHLNFTLEQLKAFLPAGQAAGPAADEAERLHGRLQGGFLSDSWAKTHEIPDVERFDLILAPDKLQLKYVGTDIHWQEYWAQVKAGQPLRARLATMGDIPRVVSSGRQVPEVDPPAFDPLANGLCDYANEFTGHKCPNRPGDGDLIVVSDIEPGEEDDFVSCAHCGSHFVGQGARAKGRLWGKHAPLLENADVIVGAVSTNVLDG